MTDNVQSVHWPEGEDEVFGVFSTPKAPSPKEDFSELRKVLVLELLPYRLDGVNVLDEARKLEDYIVNG